MKIFGKYLYISNVKFTMKGCPENFVIFWCFSVHDMNHMWFEFCSSPTTPSWFFTEKSKKYTQYLTVLTNKNLWHKIWLILHHPKKFEHHWIKNEPAVRFYFWTLFANLSFLNFIACAIVQWQLSRYGSWGARLLGILGRRRERRSLTWWPGAPSSSRGASPPSSSTGYLATLQPRSMEMNRNVPFSQMP